MEEEMVTQTLGRDCFENMLDLGVLHALRLREIKFPSGDLVHRGVIEQILLFGPGQPAIVARLLACSRRWLKMGMRPKECS